MEEIKKILVLGSGGLVGHKIYLHLKNNPKFKLYSLSKSTKIDNKTIIHDVSNFKKLKSLIKKIEPNYIIKYISI